MSQERKSISDLVNLLIKAKKDQHHIVFVLESMIKQHMMYGANLQEQINYQIAVLEKELV
jgi:predicted CopG family antitoxin